MSKDILLPATEILSVIAPHVVELAAYKRFVDVLDTYLEETHKVIPVMLPKGMYYYDSYTQMKSMRFYKDMEGQVKWNPSVNNYRSKILRPVEISLEQKWVDGIEMFNLLFDQERPCMEEVFSYASRLRVRLNLDSLLEKHVRKN